MEESIVNMGRKTCCKRILFVSSTTSSLEYANVQRMHEKPFVNASQVMFSKVLLGLSQWHVANITVLSNRPIKRGKITTAAKFVNGKCEIENNVEYHYISKVLLPIIGSLWELIATFMGTASWIVRNRGVERLVVCDTMVISAPIAMILAKAFGVETIAYITDIPSSMTEIVGETKGFKQKAIRFLYIVEDHFLRYYDKYILVSEQMNKSVNKKGRPRLVVECIVTKDDYCARNCQDNEIARDDIVGFFGKTDNKLGAKLLVDAIMHVKMPRVNFLICGTGDYDNEIIKASLLDKRIRYFGYLPHEDVVGLERKCNLLVNLRPSCNSFTQTAFPSKLGEYLLTGVPVLTTRLAGIPHDYDALLWYLHEETPEGAAAAIEHLLSLPESVRKKRADEAREYMITQKDIGRQADRIIKFLSI